MDAPAFKPLNRPTITPTDQATGVDDITHASPGALRGETIMTLNTRQAQRFFLGRPIKQVDGDMIHPGIIGVRRFATLVRQVMAGARADDPYADQCLIKLDAEFRAADQAYADLLQHVHRHLQSRKSIDIIVAASLEPLKIDLKFSHQYGYRAAYLVADFDAIAAAILSAHHTAVMPRIDCEHKMKQALRIGRRIFNVPARYRFSGASREDVIRMTARGRAALARFGAVPEEILRRDLAPDYGAVRVSDGSPILPPAPEDEALPRENP